MAIKEIKPICSIKNDIPSGVMIYQALVKANMSQKELAEKVGVSNTQINFLINGKNFASPFYYFKIAQVLDLDFDELMEKVMRRYIFFHFNIYVLISSNPATIIAIIPLTVPTHENLSLCAVICVFSRVSILLYCLSNMCIFSVNAAIFELNPAQIESSLLSISFNNSVCSLVLLTSSLAHSFQLPIFGVFELLACCPIGITCIRYDSPLAWLICHCLFLHSHSFVVRPLSVPPC